MKRDLETVANEYCEQIEESRRSLGILGSEVEELVKTYSSIDLGSANWERRRAAKSAKVLKAALDRFIEDQGRLSSKIRKIACTTRFPA
ncbi:MAG: hypothetical protein ACP5D5_09115 [Acidithiobacillus sp.]|uniref:hypothetical protein n=1 Tax=Acidithiobacillus sp. TaxID=1872118 RepID=UPI003CFCB7B1